MKYREDIDGLRTIAVVPVLIYHSGIGIPGGFIGVDVFFVISGFLITGLISSEIQEERFSIIDFYERRARRLLPALFATVLATTIVATAIMSPLDLVDYGKSIIATVLFTANIYFFLNDGYFTEAAELKPLLHMWSLGVEEQFYITFPFILLALAKVSGRRGVAAGVAVLMIFSFAAAVITLTMHPQAAFYLPHLRAWELLVGSLIALLAPEWRKIAATAPRPALNATAFAGLAGIVWAAVSYSAETPFPAEAALPPCLGAALLILTGEHGRTFTARLLALRPMVFVGKLSYSLYLWHWPVISLVYYATGELTIGRGLACLSLSFGLAYLSWRFVERPFRLPERIGRRGIFASSTAAMFVFLGVGAVLWRPENLFTGMFTFAGIIEPGSLLHDRRDCHFVTADRARRDDVCLRGAVGIEPSFALVGDSHADAFSPALFAAAEKMELAGYQLTDAGFRPLVAVRSLRGRDDTQVDAFIAFLERRPNVKVLIVTAYWQHQMNGYTYRHKGDVWVDEGYDGSGSAYNRTATLNGLRRFTKRFPDRLIVLLDDVPSGDALHIREQARRILFEESAMRGLPRAEYEAQVATYEPALKGLAESIPNLHYRPIFDALCGEEVCPLVDGDALLFRDGDHLSYQGALRLTAQAENLLASLP